MIEGRTEVYAIRWQGRRVARVGSVAGLVTATSSRASISGPRERDIISFAYVHEGAEWFASWARKSEPRTIDVQHEGSHRTYRVEVTGIFDASQEGIVYEAEVSAAEDLTTQASAGFVSRRR
jgi:hypothetical protein